MFPITVDFWTLPVEGFEVFNPVMLPDGTSGIVKPRALWITAGPVFKGMYLFYMII